MSTATLTAPATTATGRELPEGRAGLRSYPIDQTWRRRSGLYVARLGGEDPKYGVKRDWLDGKTVKSRGTIEYGPKDVGELPAWVLRRPDASCHDCGQPRPVKHTGEDVIAAFESGWQMFGRIFGSVDLLAIHEAGLPGADGAWDGRLCATCEVSPVFGTDTVCHDCPTAEEAARLEAVKAAGAGLEEPF